MPHRTLRYVAKDALLDEFVTAYRETPLDSISDTKDSLLLNAASNMKGGRVPIARFLLAEGADPTYIDPDPRARYNCLHILFGSNVHDVDTEAPLLAELLDRGADINLVAPKWGTPLQALASASNFRFTDEDLAPFYDVIFARDDLDLLKVGAFKKSTYVSISNWVPERARLVERMNTYLTERSIPIPNTQETMTE